MPPYGGWGVVRMCQDVGRQSLADTTHQRGVVPYGYVWKAKGEEILRKIQRTREALARSKVEVPVVYAFERRFTRLYGHQEVI